MENIASNTYGNRYGVHRSQMISSLAAVKASCDFKPSLLCHSVWDISRLTSSQGCQLVEGEAALQRLLATRNRYYSATLVTSWHC